jgi:LCP family protein required for cell wall assembly
MLVTMDRNTNKITCTSIPRDTRADVHKLDGDGNITSTITEKINHAYAYGGGPNKYSAQNAMRGVEELLECGGMINVPINYYISIDLDGVPKLANAIGGVEVTLDQSVPDVGRKGEAVLLKGETTRKFLQNRYDMDDGEFARQKHEQQFIKSLVREIKSMGAVEAAPELYDTFIKFMRTDIGMDEVLSLASVLDDTSIDEMQFNLMQNGNAEVIGGTWYYRASQDEMIKMMLEALYNKV